MPPSRSTAPPPPPPPAGPDSSVAFPPSQRAPSSPDVRRVARPLQPRPPPPPRAPSLRVDSEPGTPQLFHAPRLQAVVQDALGRSRSPRCQTHSPRIGSHRIAAAAGAHAEAASSASSAVPSARSRASVAQAVLLRPQSASSHLFSRFSKPLAQPIDETRGAAFGRTVFVPAGSKRTHAAQRPQSARPASATAAMQSRDTAAKLAATAAPPDPDPYPDPDTIPVPPRVLTRAERDREQLRELGSFYDGQREVHGWGHAAQLRAVPLEVDQEQALMQQSLQQIEQARRALSATSTRHRDALESRPRPWRSGDALERDARWEAPQHRSAVHTLRQSLDSTLLAWRASDEAARRHEYETLPERQTQAADSASPPTAAEPRPNDMLYNLLLRLECMLSELRVYDEVFQKITLPSSVGATNAGGGSEIRGNVVCPSAPLRDLLDRIRVAHRAVDPVVQELVSEVRRRLKCEWMLDELARRKEHTMEDTHTRLNEWEAVLEAEQARSQALTDDLQQTKDALVRYSDDAFHQQRDGIHRTLAGPLTNSRSVAPLLYDPAKKKLRPARSPDELALVQLMPTQYHGEGEPDQGGSGDDSSDEDGTHARWAPGDPPTRRDEMRAAKKQRESIMSAQQRREVRRQQRVQLRLAAAVWRRRRLGQLQNLQHRPGGLTAEEADEFKRLDAAQRAANEAERRGEEETIDGEAEGVSDSEEEDDESTDSDSVTPSASVLRRRARIAALSPAARVQHQYDRLSRAVLRSWTTRPLLQVHPLTSGSRYQGRVWTNSVYFSFELAPGDSGVWVRLFAAEAGTHEEHLELMLACGAPPTKRNRFATTATRDAATHCSLDLRDGEMQRAAAFTRQQQPVRDRQAAASLHPSASPSAVGAASTPVSAASLPSSSRWYLRVLGRGLRLKHFTLEFRIHTSLGNYAPAMAQALDDLDTQAHWQESLQDKAMMVQHYAREALRQQRTVQADTIHPDARCELDT